MSQPVPEVETIVSGAKPQPRLADDFSPSFQFPKTLFRVLAGLLVTPILLIAAAVSFAIILIDFAFFRLHELRKGHPRQKGLWEF